MCLTIRYREHTENQSIAIDKNMLLQLLYWYEESHSETLGNDVNMNVFLF